MTLYGITQQESGVRRVNRSSQLYPLQFTVHGVTHPTGHRRTQHTAHSTQHTAHSYSSQLTAHTAQRPTVIQLLGEPESPTGDGIDLDRLTNF